MTTALAVVMGLCGWLFGPAGGVTATASGTSAGWTADASVASTAPAAEVAAWRADRVSGQPLPDPGTATADQVAHFFAGLGGARRSSIGARYPQIVGNLDGVPLATRFAANASAASASPRRQLIEYDPRGTGRVAEVVGDLATADRIGILVPGVGNRLDNFDDGYGGVLRRSPAWQARQLYQRVRADDGTARIAVIAWLGYQPPVGIGREAMREERARVGAAALTRFVAGLAGYRPTATVTLVGHSYGSVVAGLAARALGRRVHDIVVLGSPGMGVDRVAQLHTAARVWAGSARGDWTRRLPGVRLLGVGHGRLPIDARFGAHALPVDNVVAHDGYFMPGSDALRVLALILLGRSATDRG